MTEPSHNTLTRETRRRGIFSHKEHRDYNSEATRRITRSPDKLVAKYAAPSNFERSVLGCIHEEIQNDIVHCSQFDEICFFVNSKVEISFIFILQLENAVK